MITRDIAMQSPTQYRLMLGRGYIYVGPPPTPPPGDPCLPPDGTLDNTWHMLGRDEGDTEIRMLWLGELWYGTPGEGNRLAFPPAYLGGHGWSWVRQL